VRPQRARRARQHWQPQRREQPHGHIAYCRRWTRFNSPSLLGEHTSYHIRSSSPLVLNECQCEYVLARHVYIYIKIEI
jgi:hypothetical protein